jgi:hypothetical protein
VVTIPAFVSRGGFARRALTIGATVGIALGALAWLDSGFLLSGVIVFVVVGVFFGIWMSRRMNRYWPGAKQPSGDERVSVVRTVRRGEPIGDPRLAQAVIDYSTGMHTAANRGGRIDGCWYSSSSLRWGQPGGTRCRAHGAMRWRRLWLLANADRAVDIAEHLA